MHVHISHELDLADLNVIYMYVQQQNRLHIHHKQGILTNSVTLWILQGSFYQSL